MRIYRSLFRLGVLALAVSAAAAPSPVVNLSGVIYQDHGLALQPDGSLWVWGHNLYGTRLPGPPDQTAYAWPARIGDGFAEAFSGADFSVALREDGSLWGWGRLGTDTDKAMRRLADGVKRIAGQGDSVLALGQDGRLWALGRVRWKFVGNRAPWPYCSAVADVNLNPVLIDEGIRDMRHHGNGFLALGEDGRLRGFNGYTGDIAVIGADPAGKPWQGFELDNNNRLDGAARVQAADGRWYRAKPDGQAYCFDDRSLPGPSWSMTPAEAPDGLSWAQRNIKADGDLVPDLACRNSGPNALKAEEIVAGTGGWVLGAVSEYWQDTFIAMRRDSKLFGCGLANLLGGQSDDTARRQLQEIPLDRQPQFSAAASGAPSRHSVTVRITPTAADAGQRGHYFVAAVVGGQGVFGFVANSWRHEAGDLPGAVDGSQTLADRRIDVAKNDNLAELAKQNGIWLYAGYGVGATEQEAQADMLKRQLWRHVHNVHD